MGFVYEHGKMVFFGFAFFEVLRLLRFVFGVSGIVPEVLKMLVVPSLGGFCWVAYSCLFWVWKA